MDDITYGGRITLESLDREWSDPNNRWWQTDDPEHQPEPPPPAFEPEGSDPDGLPIYIYGPGDLAKSVQRVERHLAASRVQFYDRGGTLVRPIVDEASVGDGRVLTSARLMPVTPPYLMKIMSSTIRILTYKKAKDDFVKVKIDPPGIVAGAILANSGDWSFRRVSGVITAPTMRRDGTILWREGYDSSTKLLLLSPPPMPNFPQNPTKSDAADALDRLDDLLHGFPFVDDASRSVALSGILTPVARAAMAVSPLHVVSAPSPGSGKSFLVDLCSAVISGTVAPVMTAGKSEDETEKRLAATMMAGSPVIAIDNVNGQLYGDALCQCVERPIVKFRVLGESRMVEIENKTTMFATGNNISLVDDMARRSVLCNLDPNMERPELRQFDDDPLSRILDNRGQCIADALTVVRAYKIAGSPGKLPRLASFGEWSDLIRSALVWLGREDPLATMEKVRDADGRLANLRAFVAAWWASSPGARRTAAEIVDASMNDTDLQVTMKTFCNPRGNMDGVVLGTKLNRVNGRVVDGMKIMCERDTHRKINVWWLENSA